MQVKLLYLAGCPNRDLARQRLTQALTACGHWDIEVREIEVADAHSGSSEGFAGSPTITVDGTDLFDAGPGPGTWACRLFHTPTGPQGAPTVDDLVAAIKRKQAR